MILGDNFYEEGVCSSSDIQFLEKFEKPYAPLNIKIFPLLGDHDYGCGPKGVLAQIDYSKKSKYWPMPSRYYTINSKAYELIVLDTEALAQDAVQRRWLDVLLSKKIDKWRIVLAHHPIYAYGGHGDNIYLVENLLPKLCHNTDAYITGHEHNLQHLRTECGLNLYISGAAGKVRNTFHGKYTIFAKRTYGFMVLSVNEEYMEIDFFDDNNSKIYTTVQTRN
jgi:tartrate-resistant acid phosphatase type 5